MNDTRNDGDTTTKGDSALLDVTKAGGRIGREAQTTHASVWQTLERSGHVVVTRDDQSRVVRVVATERGQHRARDLRSDIRKSRSIGGRAHRGFRDD